LDEWQNKLNKSVKNCGFRANNGLVLSYLALTNAVSN
jgi:hypothetical protein